MLCVKRKLPLNPGNYYNVVSDTSSRIKTCCGQQPSILRIGRPYPKLAQRQSLNIRLDSDSLAVSQPSFLLGGLLRKARLRRSLQCPMVGTTTNGSLLPLAAVAPGFLKAAGFFWAVGFSDPAGFFKTSSSVAGLLKTEPFLARGRLPALLAGLDFTPRLRELSWTLIESSLSFEQTSSQMFSFLDCLRWRFCAGVRQRLVVVSFSQSASCPLQPSRQNSCRSSRRSFLV